MSLSRHAYAVIGLVTILTALSMSSSHLKAGAARSNPQPVVVVNSSNQSVPVSGTVGVNSLPAVQIASGQSVGVSSLPAVQIGANNTVTVGNSPTVNIGANQSIGISNGSNNPVPVSVQSSSTPITVNGNCGMLATELNSIDSYTVPQGKRLTITTLFGAATFNSGGQEIVEAFVGGVPLVFSEPKSDFFGQFHSGVVQPCQIVFGPNSTIIFEVVRNASPDAAAASLSFAGYLSDAS